MDNSKLYKDNYGVQLDNQPNTVEVEEKNQSDRIVEDMVQYVRQVGRLNQANRQLLTGIERSKFIKTS